MQRTSPSPGSKLGTEKETFDCQYKVIIIGDAGAGKSSFFYQFREGKFPKQTTSTIGAEFGSKVIALQNDKDRRVKLNVWDTAGQERYRAVTRAYYRDAKGAIILFDLTSSDSFSHLSDWLQDVKDQAGSDIDIVVVGNKCDLMERRQVTSKEANIWAKNNNVILLETSALTGEGVQEVFNILAQHIQARADRVAGMAKPTEPQAISLQHPTQAQPSGCQC